MDIVLKLRELRRLRGLTQKDAARLSGVGEKSISSFETGKKIDGLTVIQLGKLLRAYGVTEVAFFGGTVERMVAPWELDAKEEALREHADKLRRLPVRVRSAMLGKFDLMLDAAKLSTEISTTAEK